MTQTLSQLLKYEIAGRTFDRLLKTMGHLFFAVLAVMAVIYYKERLLSIDSANYTFNLLYTRDYYTGQVRVYSYVFQVLPLLLMKWGASLKTVLVAYSLSFILVYYLIYNIIVYGFSNTPAGILLALTLCLTVRYKFYGPVGEIVSGLAMVCLLIGWLTRDKSRFQGLPVWADVLIGSGLGLLLLTTHPFMVIPAVIFFGFDIIYNKKWLDWPNWVIVIITTASFWWKYRAASQNEYETLRMERMTRAKEVLYNLSDYYVWGRIKWYFDTEYAFPFVVFLLSVLALIYYRHFLSALFIAAGFIGLLSLIIVSHAYLDTPVYIMIDGYLAHLGFVWSIPVFFIWLRSRRAWVIALALALLVFGADRIHNKRKFFQQRLAYLQCVIDEYSTPDNRKLLAHMEDFEWKKLWMPWAVSLETYLLTSLEDPENPATLYYQKYGQDWDARLDDPNFFLGVHYAPTYHRPGKFPPPLPPLPKGTYQKIRIDEGRVQECVRERGF